MKVMLKMSLKRYQFNLLKMAISQKNLKRNKKLMNRKGGAQSVQELRQRLQAKLESLQGPKSDKPGKKKKLTKEEKKLKMQEKKRLESKLAKMANSSATPTPSTTTNGISKAKPVYNSEGKMVYSKFDL